MLTTEEMKTVISLILANNPVPNESLRICLPFKQTLEAPYNQYDQLDSYDYNAYNDTYVKEITYEDLCQVIRQLSKELKELPEYIVKQYQSNFMKNYEVKCASCYVPQEIVDRVLPRQAASCPGEFSFARKIELDLE